MGVTLYFGAARKCSREIFYLKKFLLACGTKGAFAISAGENSILGTARELIHLHTDTVITFSFP